MRPVTTPPSSSPRLRVLPGSATTTGPHEALAATVVSQLPAELVVVARVAAGSVAGLILNLLWLAAH